MATATRYVSSLFFVLLTNSFLSAAALPVNWWQTGLSDTSVAENILQLTGDEDDLILSSDPSFNTSPWDRTGRWIVYQNRTRNSICKINTISGETSCLTDGFAGPSESVRNPSIGPDGKVYFEKKSLSASDVWRMNIDGTDRENLTSRHNGSNEQYVKVSPDGQWIAFFRDNALWTARSDGTDARKISGSVQVLSPQHSWSPDSQWLVYQGVDGISRWIYKAKRDGSTNEALTKPFLAFFQQTHSWATWSPDGETIVYLSATKNISGDLSYSIRTITPDGQLIQANVDSAVTTATDWYMIDGPFSWSPDGQWFSYVKEGSGDKAIFIVNPRDPASKAQLTTGYDDMEPVWSPAGNRLLFRDAGPG